jgi:hypothetical protein
MNTYFVAYDICDDKSLRKVARTCEDLGLRRYYSEFFLSTIGHRLDRNQDPALLISLSARVARGSSRPWAGALRSMTLAMWSS